MKGKSVLLVVLVAAVALAWAGQAVAAGLVASQHNMIARYALAATDSKTGACSFCHIPHGAGPKLYGSAINTTGFPVGDWSTDTIAQICFQCHGGVSTYLGAKNVTVFDGGVSHSNSVTQLTTWGEATPTGIHGMTATTITCTSCHDVHNNDIRPFLRSYSASVTEGTLQTLCVKCHAARAANANSGTRTQHPTGTALASGARSNILAKTGVPAVFKSTWSDLTKEISSNTSTDHWNLGAKFEAPGGVEGSDFGCGTCHATHNNEVAYASFNATDGLGNVDVAAAITSPGNALQPVNNAPTFGAIAAMCSACHATPAGSGPGAAGSYSHPWATQTASGAWPSGLTGVVTTANGAFFGISGTERSLDCQSCHDMHYARVAATSGTNNPSDNYALIRNECGDCHLGGSITGHHPSAIAVTAGTNVATLNVGTAPTWSNLNAITEANRQALVEGTAAVRNAGTKTYPTTGGIMTCGTCHGDTTAHNVAGTAWIPTVNGGNAESGMCLDCHSINPSRYTASAGTGAAPTNTQGGTHWVGAVVTSNYKWRGGAQNQAITPGSGYAVKYGAGGTYGYLICESCHTLKFKAGAPAAANNTGDAESTTKDTVGLLLTKSGNSLGSTGTWDNASTLCTACHGASPGTGSTHPTLPTNTAAASAYVQGNNGTDDYVTLTTTAGGGTAFQVNCESCHRPHDAKTAGYSRILEDASGQAGTFLNETLLCINCHGDAIPVP